MKDIIKNIIYMARRFKAATTLNLIGLVLAYVTCYLLMTQIIYQITYNHGVDDYERLYRMESNFTYKEWSYSEHICPPFVEGLKDLPEVESYSLAWNSQLFPEYMSNLILNGTGEQEPELFLACNNTAVSALTNRVLDGNIEWSDADQEGIVIPASVALEYFSTIKAAGQQMLRLDPVDDEKYDTVPMVVRGVYEDFPKNSELDSRIYYKMGSDFLTALYPAFKCYVKFTEGDHDFDAIVKALKQASIDSLIANSHRAGVEADSSAIEDIQKTDFRFVPLKDCYFEFSSFTQGEHGYHGMFVILVLACLLIIIISTINFLNFTLAESPMRIRSLNTRLVLGANRDRLRLSLIAECVITSVCACVVSLALCGMLAHVSSSVLLEGSIALSDHKLLVALLLILSILLGIIAGTYPAFFSTSFPLAMVLKGTYGLTSQGRRLRSALVCLQLFVSLLMVSYIGILLLQGDFIFNSASGYDKNRILVCPLPTGLDKQACEELCQSVTRLSNIDGVSLSSDVIGSTDAHYTIKTESHGHIFGYSFLYVDQQYLTTMGIKIVEGRNFLPSDTAAVIINESAHRQWSWLNMGDKISTSADETPDSAVIVGVCENIRYGTTRTNNDQPYVFILHHNQEEASYLMNVRVSAGTDRAKVRQQVIDMLREHGVEDTDGVLDFNKVLASTYHRELRYFQQFGILSIICLIITLIGVFCLTMFETEYRRKEIGIRKVSGAKTGEIVGMLCRQYIPLLLCSFVLAAPLAWFFGNKTLQYFSQQTLIKWWIFPLALLVVGIIMLGAVAVQSWRTARENPVNSIKSE